MTRWIFLALWLCLLAEAAPESFLSIGDSISVGSLAHPKLKWDLKSLEDLLEGGPLSPDYKEYSAEFAKVIEIDKDKNVIAPTRIWMGDDPDVPGFLQKTWADLKKKYAGGFIDLEEYSWPYLLARKAGVPTKKIYMVGEGGKRAGDTEIQAKRGLVETKNVMPEMIVVSFTGNDLCSHRFTEKEDKTKKDHADRLLKGLTHLLAKGTVPKDKQVNVFVVSHLNVAQLIESDRILDKKVAAFGKKEMSCKELRKYVSKEDVLKTLKNEQLKGIIGIFNLAKGTNHKDMPPVTDLCRSILSLHKGDKGFDDGVANVKKYTKAYREGAEDAVKQANELQKDKFKDKAVAFHFLKASEEFEADADDLANDCFHLRREGAEKLTRLLEKEIRARKLL